MKLPSTTRRAAALLTAAVAMSACAGPEAPIDVGAKTVPIDLLLGRKVKKVAEAPVPPLLLPTPRFVPIGGVGDSSPTTSTTMPAEPPGPCPEADPLDVPADIAENRIQAPPKPAVLKYRTTGRLTTGGATATAVVLGPESKVTVEQPQSEPADGFTFRVTVENAATAATTTTYRVLPTGASADPPASPVSPPPEAGSPPRPTGVPAGLYLAEVAQAGSTISFRPQFPGIPIVRTPIDLGTTFDAVGTDGATTMSWRSKVVAKANVDACGTFLDSYVVELTNGRITGGEDAEAVTFTSRMNIGSQFGGLILHMATETTGMAGSTPVNRTVTMTVNSKPALS